MLKRLKSDKKKAKNNNRKAERLHRVLVVDDDADAGKLVAQVLRTANYEVGELNDAQVALTGIVAEPDKIGIVVLSFTHSGATACLKMLDSIRTHPDSKVSQLKVLIVLDSPRQQLFTWQAGADEVLARPYHASNLVESVADVLSRSSEGRSSYRREMIGRIEQSHAADTTLDEEAPVEASIQFS